MNNNLPEAFQPRVGLSSIELWNETEAPLLPEDTALQPIDASVEAKLREILEAKTFERTVLDAFRPQVRDRSILVPGIFYALRQEVQERIEQALQQESDPQILAELQSAAALLGRQAQAHDLGEQFRYALLKG